MQTIEDILIATQQTDRIWQGDRALCLWRALHLKDKRINVPYPEICGLENFPMAKSVQPTSPYILLAKFSM